MTANRIIHHIFSQPDIRHVDQSELERLVDQYPYFAAAHLLLAQKQFSLQQDMAAPAMKKAQLYSTAQQLYQFVQEPITPAAEPTPEPVQETTPEAVTEAPTPEPVAEAATVEPVAEPIITTTSIEDIIVPSREETIVEAWQQEELVAPATPADEVSIVEEWQEQDLTVQPDAISQQVVEEWHDDLVVEAEAPETPITDEVVAIDYEAMNEVKAIDDIIGEGKDEVVAIDYEVMNEEKAIDDVIGEGKDEVVAIDYEVMNEEKAIDEVIGEGKDEVVAIDYEAIGASAYEPEVEEEDIEVASEIAPVDAHITIPAAPETAETHPAYEPEVEEEEIEVETDAAPVDAHITIPAAPEAAETHPAYDPEVEEEEIEVETDAAPVDAHITIPAAPEAAGTENLEEGPIRIQPMDTPAEETILTFQPLYTEDYFAYKKLKEPNQADTMNEKGVAEMRSFTDWLRELKDNFAAGQSIRNRYQQQMHKLYEDEEPEVSEVVEKMAMDSITLTNDIVSETLAEIWVRQHQHEKAIAIYEKLSLLNPDKNAYFAQKIKELQLLTDNNK